MTSDTPVHRTREESAESFSAYRKLILRELERLDSQFSKQTEIVNTIRIEIVRLAESIEANAKDLNQTRGEAKSIEVEINKVILLESKIEKIEKTLEKLEKKLDDMDRGTKISGAATGAGSGAAAAAIAELIKLLIGG